MLLGSCDRFFDSPGIEIAGIDAAIIDRATVLRARMGLKTPDAIHIATAMQHGADRILTGDAGFTRCREIEIELIRE